MIRGRSTLLPPQGRGIAAGLLTWNGTSTWNGKAAMQTRYIARIGALLTLLVMGLSFAETAQAQHLLVPMDARQSNHLRAYGLTYWVLDQGETAEWFLNYRGGSFLLPDGDPVRRSAALRGVTVEPVNPGELARIRGIIQVSNMESVPLETAPSIAVYTPPNAPPWDDAVTLALTYADIPYETV